LRLKYSQNPEERDGVICEKEEKGGHQTKRKERVLKRERERQWLEMGKNR